MVNSIGVLILSLIIAFNLDEKILLMFGYIGAFITFNIFFTYLFLDNNEESENNNDEPKQ